MLNVQRPNGATLPLASGATAVPTFVAAGTTTPEVVQTFAAPPPSLAADVEPAAATTPPAASSAAAVTAFGEQTLSATAPPIVLYTAPSNPEATIGRMLEAQSGAELDSFDLAPPAPASEVHASGSSGNFTFELYQTDPRPIDPIGTGSTDACGQLPLAVTAADGTVFVDGALPTHAAQLTVAASGTTGALLATSCASTDEPFSILAFDASDPMVVPTSLGTTSIDAAGTIIDLSDDGTVLAVIDLAGARAFDLAAGTEFDLLPDGCVTLAADATVGAFVSRRTVLLVADCDGVVSLLAGEPGALSALATFDGAGTSVDLTIDRSAIDEPATGWVAVTDRTAERTYVVGGGEMFGPFPTDGRVAFAPLHRAGSD